MAYEKIGWKNGQAPYINGTNLEHMDEGIRLSCEEIEVLKRLHEKITSGEINVGNSLLLSGKPSSVESTHDTIALRDMEGNLAVSGKLNLSSNGAIQLDTDTNELEFKINDDQHSILHTGNTLQFAKFAQGSDVFQAETSLLRIDNMFVTSNTLVTIVPKGAKENKWIVESYDGYFEVKSVDAFDESKAITEKDNVLFDWSAIRSDE